MVNGAVQYPPNNTITVKDIESEFKKLDRIIVKRKKELLNKVNGQRPHRRCLSLSNPRVHSPTVKHLNHVSALTWKIFRLCHQFEANLQAQNREMVLIDKRGWIDVKILYDEVEGRGLAQYFEVELAIILVACKGCQSAQYRDLDTTWNTTVVETEDLRKKYHLKMLNWV